MIILGTFHLPPDSDHARQPAYSLMHGHAAAGQSLFCACISLHHLAKCSKEFQLFSVHEVKQVCLTSQATGTLNSVDPLFQSLYYSLLSSFSRTRWKAVYLCIKEVICHLLTYYLTKYAHLQCKVP